MSNLPKNLRHNHGVEIDPEKLRHFRALRVLSREDLSRLTGIHPKAIALYEIGVRRPREKNFKALYIALGVGPEDLLKYGFGKVHLRDQHVGEEWQ